MNLTRNMGLLLLGAWLFLTGLLRLLGVGLPGGALVPGLLVLAAGVVLLLGGGTRSLSFVLLSVWLILTGLSAFIALRISGLNIILSLLALVAGVLLLVGVRGRRAGRYPGYVLLGAWLIISGLLGFVTLNIPYLRTLLAVLMLVAGVLILLDR
ncbi:MAG TPA: hypothetical protein VGK81_03635 [Anaerolineae bacterium]|jgi:hypothetical protein